jgi:hypothetical protein
MAWSVPFVPRLRVNAAGVIFKAVATAPVTVRLADPLIDPEVALIVVAPTAVAVTLPAGFTVADDPDALQVAD